MKYFLILTFFCSHTLFAIEWNIRGQASLWNNSSFDAMDESLIGLRYIPEASLGHSLNGGTMLDAAVSYNTVSTFNFQSDEQKSSITPYRFWLRYSGSQFEARVGLQQIKFGPAMILRPMMWFDQLDPRDPLQFTKGVPAALFRYYFLNNATLSVWGVKGDNKTKGLEIIPSEENSIELGGRAQAPVFNGEAAISYHYRTADISPLIPEGIMFEADPIPEQRLALDGKWDLGIGFWFEGVVAQKSLKTPSIPNDFFIGGDHSYIYQKYLTIGADYTFGLGNGLHVLGEHFIYDISPELNRRRTTTELSALMMSYNLSLWDQITGLIYFNWDAEEIFNYFTWRRTFDNFIFNISMFWNPDSALIGAGGNSSSFGRGKGFQIMVVYNH
jgi:hypothetical protein